MQPKLGESAGHLGGGYELFIVDDWIAIDTPTRQTRFGPTSEQLSIPYSQVIVCTKDDNYFFIAHASLSAADATVYQIDLVAGTHSKFTLPNNHTQIMGHILSISPNARERDPMMLTGDGKIISGIGSALGYSCATITGLFVLAIIATSLVVRLKKKRRRKQDQPARQ